MKKKQITSSLIWVVCVACQFPGFAQEQNRDAAPVITPETKASQMLMSHKELAEKQYLAFPALVTLPDNKVLITFKRGTAHGNDRQADCDIIRLNTTDNQVSDHRT